MFILDVAVGSQLTPYFNLFPTMSNHDNSMTVTTFIVMFRHRSFLE